MMTTTIRAASLAACLAGGLFADPIQLTFAGPGSGTPGTWVQLNATAVNISGIDQDLMGLGFTFAPPFSDFDDSAFLNNWPLTLTAFGPDSEFGIATLFEILIPLGTPVGLYTGNQLNLYGGEGGSQLLTTQPFDVVVVASVPEPGTLWLIALGIAFAIVRLVRTSAAKSC